MGRPRRKPAAPKNRTAEPDAPPPRSDKDERDARIWQLDLSGYSSREIGLKVGLSKTVVCEILQRLRATESPAWSTEEIRATAHARLLRLLRALEPGIGMCDPASIKEARMIDESIRRLYGVDGPIRINMTETTQADLAIHDMLNEARMRVAIERAKAAGEPAA
jgi:hypothetical protein